jgi:hypothetical protein
VWRSNSQRRITIRRKRCNVVCEELRAYERSICIRLSGIVYRIVLSRGALGNVEDLAKVDSAISAKPSPSSSPKPRPWPLQRTIHDCGIRAQRRSILLALLPRHGLELVPHTLALVRLRRSRGVHVGCALVHFPAVLAPRPAPAAATALGRILPCRTAGTPPCATDPMRRLSLLSALSASAWYPTPCSSKLTEKPLRDTAGEALHDADRAAAEAPVE